jgi:hypothetical protein
MLRILDYVPEYNDCIYSKTIYDIIDKPTLSINKYSSRLYKYIICNPNVLEFVMYYLSVYINNKCIKANMNNIHKLFLTASTIAHKFWYDECYENKQLSKIGGVTTKELNELEIDFLNGIEWDLYKLQTEITKEEFIIITKIITNIEYCVIEAEYIKEKKQKINRKIKALFSKKYINSSIVDVIDNIKKYNNTIKYIICK